MIADATSRALAPGAPEADVLAAAFVIRALEPRAQNGLAEKALAEVAARASGDASLDVALMARALAADEGTAAGTEADRRLGVVTDVSLLGPFHDTGGGLDAHDGPEAKGASFADAKRRYSWGTVEVAWRPVPPRYAAARGVPLDLFIAPRTESCSFVATAVTVPVRQPVVLRVAATGSVRLVFDGADVARSDDVETSAFADRIAVEVDATPGPHLVAAKVCAGALADDGRVRLRLTDPHGAALALATSSDLTGLTGLASPAPGSLRAVRALETPLTRSLRPRDRGVGAQLDAAIARTLGGADDTRSPRAPGILDALTRLDGLDPDSLAMIGWISPSGANRSAVLLRAISRAAGLDSRARAFAERRLIAQRMGAGFIDWAMSSVLAANLGSADAEAVLLHALVEEGVSIDGLRTGALLRLERFSAHRPEIVPTALLRELAELGAMYDPGEALAALEQLAARGYRGHDLVSALGARSADAVVQAARTALDGNLVDADDGLAVAQALSSVGRHEDAMAAYEKMTSFAPNRPESWAGLARELSAVGSDGGARMLEALRRARELDPTDVGLRAEVALRRAMQGGAGAGASATARDDERYLASPEVFLARRKGVLASGVQDVADRELHWLTVVVLHPDGRVSDLVQYAREVVIAPRTQGELIESLPSLLGDSKELVRARVYRKDGSVALPAEQDDDGPFIRWPELRPGDTVEVVLRAWTSHAVGGRGDAPFSFVDHAGAVATHPLLYNEAVVEAPRSSPIYLDVLHGDPDRREERDEGDRHITRLLWEHPDVIPDEPLAPSLSEIAPTLVGSTYKDWSDFRAWYTGAIHGFTVPDDEVRSLAASLTRGKTTREARVAALFDFVADAIRYVNYQSGEYWLPNRPQQLLARREGDCDDKAVLLITLLSAIGIEAEEVLVQTRNLGQPSLLGSRKAALPHFTHGIVFLPGPGGGEYLDATSPGSRIGPLPSVDARALGFRVQAGAAEISPLPSSSPREHGSDVQWSITLHEDGSGDLVGEERAVGDAAFMLRGALTQPDARVDYVRDQLVAPWLPTVVVDRRVDFKGELPRGEAWVRYTAHAQGLARREQGELMLAVGQKEGLTSQLASLVTRTLPVVLSPEVAPSHDDRSIRFKAPAGFAWASVPAGGDENGGEFGSAHLDVGKDPRDPHTLVVRRTVVLDQDVIAVAKYPAWRAWLQRVDRLMHKDVRLVATAGSAPGR